MRINCNKIIQVYKETYFGYPNHFIVILKWLYMWVLHLRLGIHLRLLKSPMGYFKTNLNVAIAFKAGYSYNFVIPPTHVLTFTN